MRKCILMWGLLALAVGARAETGFLKNLPPEDFTAAGLQKLTPEELDRLEALIQRSKTGEVTEARQQAEAKALAAQQEAEKKIMAAELKAREAEAQASAAVTKARAAEAKAAAGGKQKPSWFKALVTLERAGKKPEKEEALESRLVGDFSGWTGSTVFALEDGTRWVQQNRTDTHVYYPVKHAPKVKIKPAALRGFWLEIEGVNLNVRVMPLDLAEQK